MPDAPSGAVSMDFTKHATCVMEERAISRKWVESVVADPGLRSPDPNDPEVERFYGRITDRGDQVLRVAVNTRVVPWRIVSVFFDRSKRGQL